MKSSDEKNKAEKQLQPESLEDVKKGFFKFVWMWALGKPWWVKVPASFVALVLLIFVARLNFFGDPSYRYSKFLIPINLSGIDAEIPVVAMSFEYDIEDDMGRRTGKLGQTAYSGDRIYLTIQVGGNCWLSVFCVDAKGIQPVFLNKKFDPIFVAKGHAYTRNFHLDETVGNEFYYAVAAHKKFSFEDDIRPHLRQVFPKGNSKGPKFSEFQLELPEIYSRKLIYFYHDSRD